VYNFSKLRLKITWLNYFCFTNSKRVNKKLQMHTYKILVWDNIWWWLNTKVDKIRAIDLRSGDVQRSEQVTTLSNCGQSERTLYWILQNELSKQWTVGGEWSKKRLSFQYFVWCEHVGNQCKPEIEHNSDRVCVGYLIMMYQMKMILSTG
jgi:hypothetical protein